MKSIHIGAALLSSAFALSTIAGGAAPALAVRLRVAAALPHRAFVKPSPAEIRNALKHASSHRAKRDDAQYTVIDDPNEGYALGQGTFAFGLNSSGAVVGYYDNGVTHGYERATDGSYRTIDVGKRGSGATDISDKGAIVGQTNFYADQGGECPAFLLTSKGKLRKFEPPDAGCSTDTFSIGNDASIVGDYIGTDDVYHGFLRTKNGAITAIDAPGAVDTFASDINENGAVAGSYEDNNGDHGYILSAGGTFTTFDAPGGPAGGDIAARINDLGEVEGDYSNVDGVQHGLIRNPDGSLVVYDAPDAGHGPGQGTWGFSGIDNQGTATGYYVDANNIPHGYVRTSDGALTEFDPPGSIWTAVWDLNDDGTVTGTYLDQFGLFHGFLRTP